MPKEHDQPVLTTASGLRFQVTRGTADPEELEVLAAAIDRLAALDSEQLGPWVSGHRPGIGLRAWGSGDRWTNSLRGTWGHER
jgi:hypothetical protein